MSEVVKKQRLSNFELMRITSMFMIVVWHFIIHSNLLLRTSGALNLFLNFIYIAFAVHVNSFVLVCGYFQYDKPIKLNKFFSLFTTTWFYKAVYALIFSLSGIVVMSKLDLFFFLQPINYSYSYGTFYWFINVYLVFYLLIPFFNIMIKNMTQKKHRYLIIILFILLSIIPWITRNQVLNNDGATLLNFILLYVVGSYLGKYKIKDNYHFKIYSDNKRQLIILFLLILSILISFSLRPLSTYFSSFDNAFFKFVSEVMAASLTAFSSPFIIIQSILYFLFFETLKIKSRFINKVSGLMFGVYLVHENAFVYNYIYQFLPTGVSGSIDGFKVVIAVFVFSIVIFVLSMLIEFLRKKLFVAFNKLKVVKKIKFKIINYIKEF